MTKEDKQHVISICRILADKMDDSGKVAVEQVISAVQDLEEQLPEQDPVFYPQVDGITPTVVKQKPKTGRWINRHIIANKSIDMIVCSECGEEFSYDAETGISEYNYCPNCGAKMEEQA